MVSHTLPPVCTVRLTCLHISPAPKSKSISSRSIGFSHRLSGLIPSIVSPARYANSKSILFKPAIHFLTSAHLNSNVASLRFCQPRHYSFGSVLSSHFCPNWATSLKSSLQSLFKSPGKKRVPRSPHRRGISRIVARSATSSRPLPCTSPE